MKILFVHERFGDFGGAEANVSLTARELRLREHKVGILHGPGTGHSEPEWREIFDRSYALEPRDKGSAIQSALWDFQPDLLYVHKMSELEVLEAILASGIPTARMVHDHDLYCMRRYKYNPLSRRICERAAGPCCLFPCGATLRRNREGSFPLGWVSYSDKREEIRLNQQFQRMIVATHYMQAELIRNGFAAAKIEVHPPVPCALEVSIGSSFSERNRIIYAGQIIRGKGVDVLLRALARITIPFECLILGEGNHRAFCEQLSRKLGLGDRVRFEGYIPQTRLGAYYQEASVAVLSSVWPEPFGAVGLEAMRYGLPVVAFNAGGIKEWLISAYNGYLVPWMDCAAFACRVQELLLDKNLARQMGERGRRLVNQKFQFSNYISGLERLFARVVDETQKKANA
jgi:glycosyltransferase involved in cell wall biosynthesis